MSLVDFISLGFVGVMAVMITAIVTSSLGDSIVSNSKAIDDILVTMLNKEA